MTAIHEPERMFLEAAEEFGTLVDQIGADDWERSTPCVDWDVAELVGHVVDEMRWTPPLLDGLDLEEAAAAVETQGSSGDLMSDWRVSASLAAAAAIAAEPEITVHTAHGPLTAADLLSELFTDVLIHSWDLATALDRDAGLTAEQIEVCARWFAGMEDAWRAAGAIGPRLDTPPDADELTVLLAAFGRRS